MDIKQQTVLKIRFIVFNSSVAMEVLEQDSNALGVVDTDELVNHPLIFVASNKFQIEVQTSSYFISKYRILLNARPSCVPDIDSDVNFEIVKQALTEFADAGAFHRKNVKPLPRVETDGEYQYYTLFYGREDNGKEKFVVLSPEEYQTLVGRSGMSLKPKPATYYDPLPLFSHSWTKVFPRELTYDDFKDKMIPIEPQMFYTFNDFLSPMKDATLGFINQINAKTADFEIWQFEMKIIPNE